ncbi:hypothetical protein Anapl_03956 [Anas platyrhynchos]|uniref:Uncharacterized protein n=1 Tax=Anas platyrhynchos TaxID=8839 RepID=R0KFT9_ANAPL|nr:hypothetical protein Anapl_03956 [Anas platyrhynchos]
MTPWYLQYLSNFYVCFSGLLVICELHINYREHDCYAAGTKTKLMTGNDNVMSPSTSACMIAKCFEHLIFVALTAFEKEKENNSTGNFLILHEEDLVDLNQSLKLVWVQTSEQHHAASPYGCNLRGTTECGHVSPALLCLDFYVLTAGMKSNKFLLQLLGLREKRKRKSRKLLGSVKRRE